MREQLEKEIWDMTTRWSGYLYDDPPVEKMRIEFTELCFKLLENIPDETL